MTGTAASIRITGHGITELPATLDLQPTASGAWTDTGLATVLPAAGTYLLDATVRAAMIATSPGTCFILARLVSDAGVVPLSEVFIQQMSLTGSAGTITSGEHSSAPIQVEHIVTGPATVHLQAARHNATTTTQTAWIYSGPEGRTTLRWHRVA